MAGSALSDTQRKVLDRIDDEEIVRLASDLVRIPSFTTEETPCAEWIANYLGDQGLLLELQEIEPGRKQTVARLRGTGGGRSMMLNGHIDIDPLASGWTRDPFEPWIADGKIFGHGISTIGADRPSRLRSCSQSGGARRRCACSRPHALPCGDASL